MRRRRGAALRGETPQQAIVREIHEELGLTVTQVPPETTVWHRDWFETWFAFHLPGLHVAQLHPQQDELAEVMLLSVAAAIKRLPLDVARQLVTLTASQ